MDVVTKTGDGSDGAGYTWCQVPGTWYLVEV